MTDLHHWTERPNATRADNPLERNPDAITNRLEQILSMLNDSRRLLAQIEDKFIGPRPRINTDEQKDAGPPCITDMLSRINAQAQDINVALSAFSQLIG